MKILSKLLGLGPLATGALIIAVMFIVFWTPSLAPYMPVISVALPSLIISFIIWYRSYPSSIRFLRSGISPQTLWSSACPDLRRLKIVTTDRRLAEKYPMAGRVAVFLDDSGQRGYAVKVLRVADILNSYETTTEHERMLLLDRFAKAIEGLGEVEAKLVIERSPDGESAHILLYSEIVGGDWRLAVHNVEDASKIVSKSMDRLGVTLLDDISYLQPYGVVSRVLNPSQRWSIALMVSSMATLLFSMLSLDFGSLSYSMAISGVAGLVASMKLYKNSSKAECRECRSQREHIHFHLGSMGFDKVKILSKGVVARAGNPEAVFSKYLIFTEDRNRDMSSEDLDRKLPMYVKAFSNMLYTLEDFKIAIHVKPESPGEMVRTTLARADWHGMDASLGSVSGYFKAAKNLNIADRIMRGERPYLLSGVVEVRARVDKERKKNVKGFLDRQLYEAKSFLDTMNIYCREASDGWSALIANRFMYLPPPSLGFLESNPIPRLKALTRDFVAITPIAFRRRPAMPREGLYIGSDEMGRKVYWNPETIPNPHILILGPPGAGKSTLVKTMLFRLEQLSKYSGTGKPPSVLIIDPAGEYADKAELLREQGLKVTVIDLMEKKYNPLLLSGLEPRQRASRFIDYILGNIMPLDRFQAGVLYEAIMLAYRKLGGIDEYKPETWSDEKAKNVTIKKIYEYICWRAQETAKIVSSRGGNPELDPATSLLKDLARMLTPMAEGAFALDRTDITIEELLGIGGVVIVSFKTRSGGGMVRMSDTLQKLIVWSILEHVKDYMTSLHVEEGVKLLVVIDEGHKFLKGRYEEVPLGQHLREGRKFGASYIIVTHLPEDIPPELPNLVGTTFIFGFGNPIEAERIAQMINLTEDEYERLMGLKTGELYVKWINDPRPLYFNIEPDPRALVREREVRRWLLYEMQ